MVRFFFLPAVALATAARSQQTNKSTPRIEIDIVFPRNETYKPTEILPIVLAIQNLPAALAMGSFNLVWDIMLFRYRRISAEYEYIQGQFQFLHGTSADNPAFLVASTNVTQWRLQDIVPVPHPGYMLRILAVAPETDDQCYNVANIINLAAVMFYIQSEDEAKMPDAKGGNSSAVAANLATYTTKGACPVTMQSVAAAAATPCAVTVDKVVASSLSSRAASLAAKTSSTTILATTSKAGAGTARTVQTALAAACVLVGLTFS